jgi:cyclopropane fatty-acyl-phospholipid synthase-like methyltransferase
LSAMTAADFERRYRADPDPWRYGDSQYEHAKYEATLAACGDGPFRAALELGGSVGVFSALLAPRCERLTTIDFSETAAALSRERLRGQPQVEVVVGRIPEAVPAGRYDLVVASEVLYYLGPDAFVQTLRALENGLASGGRLVAVHWRPGGPERPLTAAGVHDELRRQPWLEPVRPEGGSDEYLLDVFECR